MHTLFLIVIFATAALNAMDFVYTKQFITKFGLEAEGNPLAAKIYKIGGYKLMCGLKALLTLFYIVVMYLYGNQGVTPLSMGIGIAILMIYTAVVFTARTMIKALG